MIKLKGEGIKRELKVPSILTIITYNILCFLVEEILRTDKNKFKER